MCSMMPMIGHCCCDWQGRVCDLSQPENTTSIPPLVPHHVWMAVAFWDSVGECFSIVPHGNPHVKLSLNILFSSCTFFLTSHITTSLISPERVNEIKTKLNSVKNAFLAQWATFSWTVSRGTATEASVVQSRRTTPDYFISFIHLFIYFCLNTFREPIQSMLCLFMATFFFQVSCLHIQVCST